MATFVSNERVAVTVPGNPNTIYIRAKMDFGTKNRVLDALTSIQQSGAAEYHVGPYLTALAEANIVGWEGPDFGGVPCTPENIARLDPDDPLVDAALNEIGKRNNQVKPASAEKNARGAGRR
jgi:hypothetical protein